MGAEARKTTSTAPVVFAIGAHPDDIEFMMAGTLVELERAGCVIHLMNVADGRCGSLTHDGATTAAIRLEEARAAARLLGATHHAPLALDLELTYDPALLRQLAAVVRRVRPTILLLPSLEDYMEDHMITARLAVTAAFVRAMPNFATDPPEPPVAGNVALYHALPYGLHDGMGRRIQARLHVDVSGAMDVKRAMLACHRSQQEWLDQTQGVTEYVLAMERMAAEVGRESARFAFAEGWRPHYALGFGPADWDPLTTLLGACVRLHPSDPKAPEAPRAELNA